MAILATAPATLKHVTWCLAKLLMAFESNTRLSGEETKLRAAVWIEANGDMGDALWSKATLEAIRSLKWMPKPSEFRTLVATDLTEQAKKMARCKAMLDAAGYAKPVAPTGFVAEPREVRLRSMRDSYRKHGFADRAAKVELELAVVEARDPEDWIRAVVTSGVRTATDGEAKRDTLPTRPPSPEMRAALDVALARKHRAQGRAEFAEILERRAQAAGALPPPHDDVPEAEAFE